MSLGEGIYQNLQEVLDSIAAEWWIMPWDEHHTQKAKEEGTDASP